LATSQYRCDLLWPDTQSIIARFYPFGNPYFRVFLPLFSRENDIRSPFLPLTFPTGNGSIKEKKKETEDFL